MMKLESMSTTMATEDSIMVSKANLGRNTTLTTESMAPAGAEVSRDKAMEKVTGVETRPRSIRRRVTQIPSILQNKTKKTRLRRLRKTSSSLLEKKDNNNKKTAEGTETDTEAKEEEDPETVTLKTRS
jgi:uncharacterized protein (UPF0147 family)